MSLTAIPALAGRACAGAALGADGQSALPRCARNQSETAQESRRSASDD